MGTAESGTEGVAVKRKCGSNWRILAWNGNERVELSSKEQPGVFDELVIDDWFHLEQMDYNVWWIGIYQKGQRHTLLIIREGAQTRVTHETERTD